MTPTIAIFDLDGTLLNTLEDLKNAVNHALTAFGFPTRTLDEIRSFVGNGVELLMHRATPGGRDNPKFEECFAAFRAYYKEHSNDLTAPYEGVIPMLAELKARGLKTAVVSNKFNEAVQELMPLYFPGLVDIAIGESETVRKKPAPDAVYLILEQLGADKEEAFFVGDSDVDIQTGKNAGLRTVGVLWGFRDRDCLVAAGAEEMISSPAELIPLVLKEG